MKYLHTMVRVTDLEQSLRFYRDALGLRELSRKDYPQGRFTLVFLAAPGDDEAQVELTHNWDTASYNQGNAFGHLAVGVDDVYKACADLKAKGVKVVREAGPMMHGGAVIAFIEDPNGYKIELIDLSGPRG